ncbi:hypothetical protein PRK78_002488 [Emydomyces testavorans]|uniref:Mitochondrial outer membrane protein OM14 C-terminal domain-containing protein n=1 Tax=Emydomyces testavorans TaxID=2070801 RepID=A0AAF0IJQ1_9EURO|nr:hypothetical protein PRK78_002488 [Emydomyces testavorans]
MSYAEAAARGPSQSPRENSSELTLWCIQAAAPQPPQVEFTDTDTTTSSLVDVDSPHVSTVPPNYESQSVKTTTQAERLQREEGEKHRERDRNAKEKAKIAKERGKAKAKGTYTMLCENKSNPVVVTNAILLTAASAGLGYGAYQKYLKGLLSWETVAWWSGGIGAVGIMDYYVSK